MNPGDPPRPQGTARQNATVLESVDDIRAQIRAATAVKDPLDVRPRTAEPEQDAKPFRPALRPAMALLTVLDDGDDTGEIMRIRANSFVIGRVEGDVVIVHDSGMSGKHAEISRRLENGAYVWFLRDLQSTNGTFVRAATVSLGHEQELLIGSRRFRFEVPAQAIDTTAPASNDNATRKWEAIARPQVSAATPPVFVDISPGCVPRRFALAEQEHWLGRDPRQCSIVIDDPMLDRRHARLYRDDKNRWAIANARSKNGIWAGIQEVGLGRGAFFQCGEQRFFFKVL
jgi:pSer/pThr/pTyr-binding forkhead associated (FHA) protein